MMDLETVQDDLGAAIQEPCLICGETNYYADAGFYYCSVCNTQSQSARLYVDENYRAELQNQTTAAAVLRDKRQAKAPRKKDGKSPVTTFEIGNVLLKHMADRLVEVGFPEIVRNKIFQLFTDFLKKRNVIFVSKVCPNARAAVTYGEHPTNLRAFYGIKAVRRAKKHRRMTFQRSAKKGKLAAREDTLSRADQRLRRTLSKKKAIEKEYLEKSSQLSEGNLLELPTEKQPQSSKTLQKVENQVRSFKLTSGVRKLRSSVLKGVNVKRTILKSTLERSAMSKPLGFYTATNLLNRKERFTLDKCLVLVFVALRQLGFPIVISDIFRLCHAGVFQTFDIPCILQQHEEYRNCDVPKSYYSLNRAHLSHVAFDSKQFVEYMEIQEFRPVQIKEIVPKYIDEFVLPREFECLMNLINHMFSIEDYLTDIENCNKSSAKEQVERKEDIDDNKFYTWSKETFQMLPEIIILVQFIVILKMLFGLDDKTEKFQSEFARLVNRVIKNEVSRHDLKMEEWTELFVIEDWFGYLRRRRDVVLRELCCSTMYTPNRPPNMSKLSQILKTPKPKGDPEDPVIQTGLVESCLSVFENIVLEETTPVQELKPYIPLPLPTQSVIEQYIERYPLVGDSSVKPELLMADFVQKRIDFIWKPKKYTKLLQLCGYKVKIIQGDAINNWPDELNEEIDKSKMVFLFQPYKNFDDFVGKYNEECSSSLQFLFGLCGDIVPIELPKQYSIQITKKPVLQRLVNEVGNVISKRVLGGLIPILTKWNNEASYE